MVLKFNGKTTFLLPGDSILYLHHEGAVTIQRGTSVEKMYFGEDDKMLFPRMNLKDFHQVCDLLALTHGLSVSHIEENPERGVLYRITIGS